MYFENFSSIVVIFLASLSWTKADQAPFQLCPDRPVSARDIHIIVNPCVITPNNTCTQIRGTKTNFTLSFTPTQNASGPIERLIMAKFTKKIRGQEVDVAYGGPVPANARTYDADTLETTEGKFLVTGKRYVHNDIFDVLANSPKTSLYVRYLIRETKPCKKSKCNFLRHPGDLIVCVEIPVSIE